MTDKIPPTSNDDLRAQAIALLEEALGLLDQLGLSAPAARLDHVLCDVRDADHQDPTF
jgi:hypothetical protein